jgi:hypothetical protein
MLTSGKKKIAFIKTRMKRSITQAPAGVKPWVYHYSEDMTRWAQQFIVPSFNLTLSPFCLEFGEIYAWNTQILSRFMRKKIELPSGLLTEFFSDPLKRYKDHIGDLQNLKDETIRKQEAGEPFGVIENRVGMWMGILHYTSSHYHLCLISFMEDLFDNFTLNSRFVMRPHSLYSSRTFLANCESLLYMTSKRYRSSDETQELVTTLDNAD